MLWLCSPLEKQFGTTDHKWKKHIYTHWPSGITFGKLSYKNNWENEKKKDLLNKDINPSIIYHHETLEAI